MDVIEIAALVSKKSTHKLIIKNYIYDETMD